jgi:EpsI family protein
MKISLRDLVIVILMLASSIVAFAMRPSHHLANIEQPLDLEQVIPQTFGDWQQVKQLAEVVNPDRQKNLDKFYAQILNRTYINKKGEAIMLSIAYGKDQSDQKQVHYPEVCYPAQGFQVTSIEMGSAKTDFGDIRVKRLTTELGARREPLTYWTTVGNQVVLGGYEAKKAQLSYGFKGYIPDGLVFRVSSISNDANEAFEIQQVFISSLIKNISPVDRLRLAGLNNKS